MELILTAVFVTAHVFFRLLYLFYIGGILRKRTYVNRGQDQLGDWYDFRERAGFVLHLDLDFMIAATVAGSCWGTAANCSWPFGELPVVFWIVSGVILILVGGYAKWDAYRIIGDKGWYWYNFFCAPDDTNYEKQGIYKWFDNPMYGVGYLSLFGLALLLLSPTGLCLAAFDWCMIWLFYLFCERPHTEQVLKNDDAGG